MKKPKFYNKNRPLILLVILCIIPPLLALFLYSHRYTGSTKLKHYGTLLSPPLQLNTFKLINCNQPHKAWHFTEKKWRLIYLAPIKCDPGCTYNLTQLNQVWRALGKRQQRVQAVAIFYPQSYPQPPTKHVNYACITAKNEAFQKKQFNKRKLDISRGTLLLADPIGNIMLVYPHHFWQEILFKDFKHLLKVSQIG